MTVHSFILENVDLDEGTGASNLDFILRMLRDCNYRVRVYKVISQDFGIPQRRVRLWFCGFHNTLQPSASFEIIEKYLSAFRLKCPTVDSWSLLLR